MRRAKLLARLGAVAVLLFVLLPTAGCWSRREINQLSFVMALGLDKGSKPGTYLVTYQVVVPSLLNAGGGVTARPTPPKPVWVPSAEGRTIMDAIRRITEFDSRRGYLHHTAVLVIGEELAREGILPVVDFLDREPEVRRSVLVFVTRGTAQRALQAGPTLGAIPAVNIHEATRWGLEADVFRPVMLQELIYSIATCRQEVIVPVLYPSTGRVSATPDPGDNRAKEPDSLPGQEVRMTGMAVFKNGKLAGFLNRFETRGYLWLVEKAGRGVYPVDAPLKGGKVFLEIRQAKTRVEPVITSREIRFKVKIEAKYDVAEVSGSLDLNQKDVQLSLSRRLAEVIRNDVRAALAKLQSEFRSDVLGFGDMVYRRRPKVWRAVAPRWPKVFAALPVEVEVKASLRATGEVGATMP